MELSGLNLQHRTLSLSLLQYLFLYKLYTVEPLYSEHPWDPAVCPVQRGVPNSEVDLYIHSSVWLGQQTVSSLERCPLFRVPFIERFHCMYAQYS